MKFYYLIIYLPRDTQLLQHLMITRVPTTLIVLVTVGLLHLKSVLPSLLELYLFICETKLLQ